MSNASTQIVSTKSLQEAKEALERAYKAWMRTTLEQWNPHVPISANEVNRIIPAFHLPLLDASEVKLLASMVNHWFRDKNGPYARIPQNDKVALAIGAAWELHRQLPGVTAATEFIDQVSGFFAEESLEPLSVLSSGLFQYAGEASPKLNTYAHFPVLQLALRSYTVNQNETLLHIADRYAERWADALLNTDALPIAINQVGPVLDLEGAPPVSQERTRCRLLIENGASDAFQHLYALTSSPIYLIALRKLLDIAASDLRDPKATYAIAGVQRYANDFDDGYFDEYIRIAAEKIKLPTSGSITLETRETKHLGRCAFEMKLDDLPAPAPQLFDFYGRLAGKPEATKRAFDLATSIFQISKSKNVSTLHMADLLRSSLCLSGLGWGKDLLDPRCPHTIG